MIEEILCVVRRQIRSIANLREEFGVRNKVQNLPIRTIFYESIYTTALCRNFRTSACELCRCSDRAE